MRAAGHKDLFYLADKDVDFTKVPQRSLWRRTQLTWHRIAVRNGSESAKRTAVARLVM